MYSLPNSRLEVSNEARSLIRELLHLRTRELAEIAGRLPPQVSQLDYEQAKRDLTGEADLNQQNAVIAALEGADKGEGATPVDRPAWTETELDNSILKLCTEFPDARMVTCSRALEYCRRWTPHGTPESLVTAMRHILRSGMQSQENFIHRAA